MLQEDILGDQGRIAARPRIHRVGALLAIQQGLLIVADQVGGVQSLVVAAAVRIYIGGFGGGRVEGAVVDC